MKNPIWLILALLTTLIIVTAGAVYLNPDYQKRIKNTVDYFPAYNPFNPPIPQSYSTQPPKTNSQSSLITSQITISSGQVRNVVTYLPPNYNSNLEYPLLVMLHGSPGKETDWIEVGNASKTLDKLIGSKNIKPMIAVFPDGNGGVDRDTQFIDSMDGTEKNASFVTRDLIKTTESNYKIKKGVKNYAIGGLSSGGFGALNLGLQNQDIFGSILSFSGYGNIEQNDKSQQLIQGSTQVINANSPSIYIPKLKTKTTKVWMVSGLQDTYNPDSKKLNTLLAQNGFDVTLIEKDGIHSWDFWSGNLEVGLKWLDTQN